MSENNHVLQALQLALYFLWLRTVSQRNNKLFGIRGMAGITSCAWNVGGTIEIIDYVRITIGDVRKGLKRASVDGRLQLP